MTGQIHIGFLFGHPAQIYPLLMSVTGERLWMALTWVPKRIPTSGPRAKQGQRRGLEGRPGGARRPI